ncbi:hypothetical protein pW2_205 [Bacillus phage pW2]|uniref:Uncharacterized protein n=1 Tax=Bacillus phage pW2 TaxID=2500559 RepID=A0A3T0IHV8_9CAUD|nr:hypothetical protein PQE69_gp120 [Bacillus phage pW2]AZU98998.1 hypothetical protein pW2_205 [Bacillus phage pW2]
MNVAEIINKVEMLEDGMKRTSNAITLGLVAGSPQHVIDGLLNDYKRYSAEYYRFMQTKVEIDNGLREVIQITWDGSFYRDVIQSRETGEYHVSYTNNIKWAKVFTDEKELKTAIEHVKEENYEYRLLKKR